MDVSRPSIPRLPQLAAALVLPVFNLGGTRLRLQIAPELGLCYYLALPKGWTAARRWPLLVTIDGANHGFFLANVLAFMRVRHHLPFIIMTPFVVSNSGRPDPRDYPYPAAVWRRVDELGALGFDGAGLLEAVATVCSSYNAAARFFLTGWSAGGHLTWYMILAHSERLALAVPVCANFARRGLIRGSAPPDDRPVPVHALQGSSDRRRGALDQQWADAYMVARARGYRDITRELLPGVGHSASPARVMAICNDIWQGQVGSSKGE